MNELQKRIVSLSYKHHSSHIGSCLAAVTLIDTIYSMKDPSEPFILSNGHAGLALYCVLEKYEKKNAEALFKLHGTHPNRDEGIWCSTGSLGHGIGIAVGMALSDPKRNVYCMVSDGECAEGSFWESLRIASENHLNNLMIIVVANGYSAYREIDIERLEWQIAGFLKDNCPKVSFNKVKLDEPFLQDLNAHYIVLDEKQYKEIMEYYEKKERKVN